MDLLERLAEAHIETAIENGAFDDLPGAGAPQQLDDDSHVPVNLRSGYRLLKNAGFVPREIEAGREIRDVEALLDAAVPASADAEHLTRRLRWLETRLRESGRGRALLAQREYGQAVRDRLTGAATPGSSA